MITPQQVFQAIAEIMELFKAAVSSLKKEISYKEGEVQKWDKNKEKIINDIIR
jgi:molybdopterin synthase catalytic subunit